MSMIIYTLQIVGKILSIVLPLLISVAYFTLAERKIMGAMQRRKGPNLVGTFGLLQPLADGFKLLIKETVIPSNANTVVFILAPIITFLLSLLGWAVIPFGENMVLADLNVGIIPIRYFIFRCLWCNYSVGLVTLSMLLGALRSAAQMVSYEVSIGVIITVLLCVGSLNLSEIVLAQSDIWFVYHYSDVYYVLISALAETNRSL